MLIHSTIIGKKKKTHTESLQVFATTENEILLTYRKTKQKPPKYLNIELNFLNT